MAEFLQGYGQILDRSGKKIILLSPLLKGNIFNNKHIMIFENNIH